MGSFNSVIGNLQKQISKLSKLKKSLMRTKSVRHPMRNALEILIGFSLSSDKLYGKE